jgi:malate dehydrogenase (oxaloacetate-decarboxylating)
MLNFKIVRDNKGNILRFETSLKGKTLLGAAKLNKGCAFTNEERDNFNLLGKLPLRVETIEEQASRFYVQYKRLTTNLAKNIYLDNLHDFNETLFFKLVGDHLEEMLPIVYTPTIGEAVQNFSLELRRQRGLFISYPDKDRITEIIANRLNSEVDIIVVTDGEGILGIGDQGVGGIDICIGKLAVYTLCAGLNPHRVLSIQLDVGTNNKKLLDDPMYLGWRHERLSGQQYDDFIGLFIKAVKQKLPKVYLHWEDFGKDNARKNLKHYRNEICSFNDDMQGTGAITTAALLAALKKIKQKFTTQRIVFFGAGTSASGIADQLRAAMVREGLSQQEAAARICLLGRRGLITEDMADIADFQRTYAKSFAEITDWDVEKHEAISLLEVINNFKPTVLIGCSTIGGAFNEEIVKTMAKHVEHPIIFPLSNPTEKAEAIPADLIEWTDGKALIATGSPFAPVEFKGKKIQISQCNNAFVFPGIGLGVIAVKASKLTDTMIWAGCEAITKCITLCDDINGLLLPLLNEIKEVSYKVAFAVAAQAIKEGVAEKTDIAKALKFASWEAKYYPLLPETNNTNQ